MPAKNAITKVIDKKRPVTDKALAWMFFLQHGEPQYLEDDFSTGPDLYLKMEGMVPLQNESPIREWAQKFWALWKETGQRTINFRLSPKKAAHDTLGVILQQLDGTEFSASSDPILDRRNMNWETEKRLVSVKITPGLHKWLSEKVKIYRHHNETVNRLNAWATAGEFFGSETPEQVYWRTMSFLRDSIREAKGEDHSGLFVNICHPENVRDFLTAANLDIDDDGSVPLPDYVEDVFVGVLPFREDLRGYPLEVIFREQQRQIVFLPQTNTISGYTPL